MGLCCQMFAGRNKRKPCDLIYQVSSEPFLRSNVSVIVEIRLRVQIFFSVVCMRLDGALG